MVVRLRGLILAICAIFVLLLMAAWLHNRTSALFNSYESTAADGDQPDSYSLKSHLRRPIERLHLRADDLEFRVQDLERMRMSMLNEIESLENVEKKFQRKRHSLQSEIGNLQYTLEQLNVEIRQKGSELSQAEAAVVQAKNAQRDALERNRPVLQLPLPIYDTQKTDSSGHLISSPNRTCTMSSCFNWRKCSITAGFRIFIPNGGKLPDFLANSTLIHSLFTNDSSTACVHLHLTSSLRDQENLSFGANSNSNINHVVIRTDDGEFEALSGHQNRAILIGSRFRTRKFRPKFDILTPNFGDALTEPVWMELPLLLPLTRKYLLSFQASPSSWRSIEAEFGANFTSYLEHSLGAHNATSDRFCIHKCGAGEMCNPHDKNSSCTAQSMYHLAVCASSSLEPCHQQIMAAFRHATVPVLIRSMDIHVRSDGSHIDWLVWQRKLLFGNFPVLQLPFESDHNSVSYTRAIIELPAARLSELHFMLRSIGQNEYLEMRRFGRVLYEQYMASKRAIVETALSTLRVRLHLPAPAALSEPVVGVFENWTSILPQLTEEVTVPQADPDEYLGPVELPYASISYQHNFTLLFGFNDDLWNRHFAPHFLHPALPFTLVSPTEAQFHEDTDFGFRSIGAGWGGSGREFSQALGGNVPREQFTVVMLSYAREQVLQASLTRLHALPYLNKVIVVWNSPQLPSPGWDIAWPKLRAPLIFVTNRRNSLNNRFLPLKEIETDAVLNLDDDVQLTHAEIVLAFRVWRESRDRIVGFPGRFHAWDTPTEEWRYNSNHSCQLSMVLTGAAFYHRYYHYAYTYSMPAAIRATVDRLLNCEDLAMNFLVSHLTRKPPIKVTSKWTFRCANCAVDDVALSADDRHFLERHECLRDFVRVFGYNPLLYTQYRVDSVLFKTRVPHTHQKCFKYV